MGAGLSRPATPQLPRRLEALPSSADPFSVTDPFSVNFTVSAHHRKLWIAPADGSVPETELRVKGANWAGFQASGCVHELWRRNVSDYVDFLVRHRYNAVRLPLSGYIVQQPSFVIEGDSAWRVKVPELGSARARLLRLLRARLVAPCSSALPGRQLPATGTTPAKASAARASERASRMPPRLSSKATTSAAAASRASSRWKCSTACWLRCVPRDSSSC